MPLSHFVSSRTRYTTTYGLPLSRVLIALLVSLLLLGALPSVRLDTITTVLAAPSNAEIEIENRDNVPFNDRLVMSRIQTPEDGTNAATDKVCPPDCIPPNTVHDTATLRVHNRGSDPLEIRGSIEGPWTLTNSPVLPTQTIAPGTFLDLPVTFVAQTEGAQKGVYEGTLTLDTNDADEPTVVVQLAGFWQTQSENNQEPNLGEMLRIFGYNIVLNEAGSLSSQLNKQGLIDVLGDEVLSSYWRRGDTTQPVLVQQLAAYHRQGADATVYWHQKGTSTQRLIFTHEEVDGQTLLPRLNSADNLTTTLAVKGFTPLVSGSEVVFGLKVDGEWSNPAKNNQTPDYANGCEGPCGHHMRFWPVRDRNGVIVQDTWLMFMDYSGLNYDYQDNVYLISNMRPENEQLNPSSPGLLPGSPNLVLEFDRNYPGTLADKDGQPTGFRKTQLNKTDPITPGTSYNPALLDIDTAGSGTLRATTSAGSNRLTDNTLVNGLLLPFDARTHRFAMTTRLLGPLSTLSGGVRQGGVMLSVNHDNFVKLVALAGTNGPQIEFVMEQRAGTPVPGKTVSLPNAANIQTLDLTLYGDPVNGTLRASYRALGPGQDSGEVFLSQTLTLTGTQRARFFGRNVGGGLLTTHKGTDTPITLSFDRFAIEDREQIPAGEVLRRIDTGAGAGKTPAAGWTSDAVPTKLYTPNNAVDETSNEPSPQIENTSDDILYHTYRGNVGSNTPLASRIITYNIPIATPQLIDLRLHFAELYWGAPGGDVNQPGPGKRIFDVFAEGNKILDDFDITAASGGVRTAVVVTLKGINVGDGSLTLAFKAERNFAAVSGIEVFASNETPPTPTPTTTLTPTSTTTPTSFVLKVNFQNDGAPTPSGYLPDIGQAYGARSDGYTYGWVIPGTNWPVDLLGNGRDRDRISDQQLDTLMHMQGNDSRNFNGTRIKGSWQVAVPTGHYRVTVAVGDALKSTGDVQTHTLNIEGTRVITSFVPSGNSGATTRHTTATVDIQVMDGRLTVDAFGGFNTKINYIDVVSLFGTTPTTTATATEATPTTPTTPTTTATATEATPTTPTTTATATETTPTTTPVTTTAKAGTDQDVLAGSSVLLNAGNSTAPQGSLPLQFRWVQINGSPVQLLLDGATATFTAPLTPQKLVFQLTVIDANNVSASDTVEIVVRANSSGGERIQVWLPLLVASGGAE